MIGVSTPIPFSGECSDRPITPHREEDLGHADHSRWFAANYNETRRTTILEFEMKNLEDNLVRSGRSRVEKAKLAKRYLVGVRTIENWQSWNIIRGSLEGGKTFFDPEECDRRLLAYKPHLFDRDAEAACPTGGQPKEHLC